MAEIGRHFALEVILDWFINHLLLGYALGTVSKYHWFRALKFNSCSYHMAAQSNSQFYFLPVGDKK